jgi:hypothetical protein
MLRFCLFFSSLPRELHGDERELVSLTDRVGITSRDGDHWKDTALVNYDRLTDGARVSFEFHQTQSSILLHKQMVWDDVISFLPVSQNTGDVLAFSNHVDSFSIDVEFFCFHIFKTSDMCMFVLL